MYDGDYVGGGGCEMVCGGDCYWCVVGKLGE